MSGNRKKNITATILAKVARNSVKAAADSRCMYCLHQPKQPTGLRKFCKQGSWKLYEYCHTCEINHICGSIYLKDYCVLEVARKLFNAIHVSLPHLLYTQTDLMLKAEQICCVLKEW